MRTWHPGAIALFGVAGAVASAIAGCRDGAKGRDEVTPKESVPVAVSSAPVDASPAAAPAAPACPPLDAAKVARFPPDSSIIDVPIPPLVDSKTTLAPFYARVARLARGAATDHVRIAMFGDSNLTADATTGRLRRQLQGRFGDGGHGYVALARPWEWYSHNDVHHDGTWKTFRQIATSTNKVSDGHYGFANIAAECAVPGCSAWVSTDPRPGAPIGWTASRFDLFYLKREGGGQFDVAIDGAVVKSIDTRLPAAATPAFEAAFERFDLPDAHHELKVLVKGRGPSRLYGVAIEREKPSLIVDSLGTGSLNFEQLTLVKNDTRRVQLQRRRYDLVIIQLGTNVFGTDVENRKNAKMFVDEVRAALPGVPVLFVSPPDSMEDAPEKPGEAQAPAPPPKHADPRLAKIAKAMPAMAEENDAAFWDWHGAMGGADAILTFMKKGLVEPDHVHLKKWGQELMADRLLSALWDGLAAQLEAHPTTGCGDASEPSASSAAGSPSATSASKTPAK